MMTDKTLKSFLDRLNNKKTDGLFHLRPLSPCVDFAKVWTKKPSISDTIPEPYKLYFIKNQEGIFVATVLDMGNDLHWFVLKTHRGKGYLTVAMRNTILFHLFQDREVQTISIDKEQIGLKNFINSEKVAISLGFLKMDNGKYILTNQNYQSGKIKEINIGLTEMRMNELKKHFNYIGHLLWLIEAELEMKMGETEYCIELKELTDEIKRLPWRLEDAWWDSKDHSE